MSTTAATTCSYDGIQVGDATTGQGTCVRLIGPLLLGSVELCAWTG